MIGSTRSRISWLSCSAPLRGMAAPNTKAPKMAWIPISLVTYDEASAPTRTIANTSGVRCPDRFLRSTRRRRAGATRKNITITNATDCSDMTTRSSPPVDRMTARTTARMIHARTSSIAAQASASAPVWVRFIRCSARIRARTGKAVTDIDAPMNNANGSRSMR